MLSGLVSLCVGLLLQGTEAATTTWFLQVSDLHLSSFEKPLPRHAGAGREADFRLFTETVASAVAPSAVVLTGDLTDSKTNAGIGLQQPEEWQVYHQVRQRLQDMLGLDSDHVLDCRGNHDAFSTVRAGKQDLYYATSPHWRDPKLRVAAHQLPAPAQAHAGDACPAAHLIGIDAAPDPGLRGPLNFLGHLPSGALQDLESLLSAAAEGPCQAPIIVYTHYPLSTIWVQPQPGRPAASTLEALLGQYNVSAALSGHLHAAAGHRLHRLYPNAAGGYMAELETSDWKDNRRFRVLALHEGQLSFADYAFHTGALAGLSALTVHSHEGSSFAVEPQDNSASVGAYLVMLVSPPDARYAPLGRANKVPPEDIAVLVLPVLAAFASQLQEAEVSIHWKGQTQGQARLRASDDARTFTGPTKLLRGCGPRCPIQASVRRVGPQHISTSQWQTVHLGAPGGQQLPPEPLKLQLLEWLVLRVPWPTFAYGLLYTLWSCVALLLALPRYLNHRRGAQRGSSALQRTRPWAAKPFARGLQALCEVANCPPLWWPQVAWAGNFLLGPWFVGRLMAERPLGAVGAGWALLKVGAEWEFLRSPGTFVMGSGVLACLALPLTLWTAWVWSSWLARADQDRSRPCTGKARLVVALQLTALAVLVWFWYRIVKRVCWQGFGLEAVLLSPGIMWLLPLHMGCLLLAKRRRHCHCKSI